jgi:hypothetical protein
MSIGAFQSTVCGVKVQLVMPPVDRRRAHISLSNSLIMSDHHQQLAKFT